MDDEAQLLFFDTFSHETSEELNLDLVQFPKPVLLSEVRIIPLGARVQADFPGGVRLGATNPSQFNIEFFVNDLSKPGASTFESLGSLDYKQNGNIQLPFEKKSNTIIPTDGLVLRGWYTTITLAVYGSVSKGLTENSNASSAAHAAGGGQTVEADSRSPRQEWNANDQRFKDNQDYQRYPPEKRTYAEQFNDDWHSEREYSKKEHWEGERWERDQPRHGGGATNNRQNWDWAERGQQQPEEEAHEWDSTNNRGGSRRNWEEQQQNSRKRPHTPPMDENKWTKSNEKSPAAEGDPKEENAVAPFETLSPGDVESISSDGDIGDNFDDLENGTVEESPANELILEQSPPSTPDQDMEQYEPILSDEDMEDAEFQDYEFDDMKDITLEKTSDFDPNLLLQALLNMDDPSLTTADNIPRNIHLPAPSDETNKFIDLFESWKTNTDVSEGWVEMLEQIVPLVSGSLHQVPENVPTLIAWVKIGLDLEKAKEQTQPAFKVRHIKSGLRLAMSLTTAGCGAASALIEANLFELIVNLFKEQYIALSLKLLGLTVLDSALSTSSAMQTFLKFHPGSDQNSSGVAFLLEQWQKTKVTRVKFILNNLIRKINFFETLVFVKETNSAADLNEKEMSKLRFAVHNLLDTFVNLKLKIGHFKRFLPVAMHFSFPGSTRNPYTAAYSFMKSTKLLDCLIVFLTHYDLEDGLNCDVLELLEQLLNSEHGLKFLASDPAATQILIKVLTEAKHPLGLKMAYCLRMVSAIDRLASINLDELSSDVEPLKELQTLCETTIGRLYVSHVLCMSNFSDSLFKIVEIAAPMSTTKNLCLDLIHSSISLVDNPEYLHKYGGQMRHIFSEENKLVHLSFWVKHSEYANIQELCQELSSNLDKAKTCPEVLIPIVRAIRALALPEVLDSSETDFEDANKRQLLLELFSHDGMSTLCSVLSTVASAFEHTELHTATLAGSRGINVVNLLLPTLGLLRAILALVASSQGANFKNLAPVGPLLKTYELLHAYPRDSPFFPKVSTCLQLTVKCLMAYTQPCSEEQLPKSTWTQMAAEVFKYISLKPNTVLPGLDLLSKLLPKPLPVCGTSMVVAEDEKKILSLYRLWGAHLHPLASAIHEMISLFSISSVSTLASKLLEICGLISDLGPSLALIVVQSVVEGVVASMKSDRKMGYNSDATKRRLALLTALSGKGAPKIALLHLLRNGGSEENGIMTLLVWVLRKNVQDKYHVEIGMIIKLLDNLFRTKELVFSPEWKASPSNEIIQSSVNCLIDLISLLASEQKTNYSQDMSSAISTLLLISESDVGCHLVKTSLEGKSEPLGSLLGFCVLHDESRTEICNKIVQLLLKCYTNFSTSITPISKVIGCDAANHEKHALSELAELTQNTDLLEIKKLVAEVQAADIPIEKVLDLETPINRVAEQLPAQFLLQTATSKFSPPSTSTLPSLPTSKEHLKILDLSEIVAATLPDLNLGQEIEKLKNMHRNGVTRSNPHDVSLTRERAVRKPMSAPARGRMLFPRSVPSSRGDTFRSRPPNTSRPPSLHVDDFLALESAGQQPTGPTGYNKLTMRAAKDMMVTRPRMRGRSMGPDKGGGRFMATPAPAYRR